jgi:hypothetical protein
MTTLNRLTLNQQLLISDWLRDKPPYPAGTPLRQIADDATSDLKFPITTFNIKSVADARGYQLPRTHKPKDDATAALQARIERLEQQMVEVLREIRPFAPLSVVSKINQS